MIDLLTSEAPLVDIGVNLGNKAFAADLEAVLDRAMDANVRNLVITGTSERESEHAVELCQGFAEQYPGMLYSTCGVHPHDAKTFSSDTLHHLRALAAESCVVAIGETGLDFNRNFSSPTHQERAFTAQLELAAELRLPVFMHERDAHQRQFEILRDYRDHLAGAVIHCFTGEREALFNYLDLDLYIGITGWVCDERRGQPLQALVRHIPPHRLLLETDAPYLLPRTLQPKPKERRNEPAYLPWVLEEVARCREEAALQLARQTSINARELFRLDGIEQ